MSSPGSVALRIELPRWLAADILAAATWAALAIGLDRIAPRAGLPPGGASLTLAAIGLMVIVLPACRRRPVRALRLTGPERLELEMSDGRLIEAGMNRGDRVLGGSVVLDGRRACLDNPDSRRCWLTPLDASQADLSAVSRALHLRVSGPPDA